jgi:heptosyltransferase-2
MARFFVPGAELDAELSAYFSGFQQIISYLSDPQGYFAANLSRAGAKQVLHAYSPPDGSAHAAEHLARPLEKLALYLENPAAEVFPSARDHAAVAQLLSGIGGPFIALHPGSGSERKNWMPERWAAVLEGLLEKDPHLGLLLIGGEADARPLSAVAARVGARAQVARHLPLPHLAAVLQRCQLFLGHDTGVAHLAAASGAPCLLLFGPTDPAVFRARLFDSAKLKLVGAAPADLARGSAITSVSGYECRTEIRIVLVSRKKDRSRFRTEGAHRIAELDEDDVIAAVRSVTSARIRKLVPDDVLDR